MKRLFTPFLLALLALPSWAQKNKAVQVSPQQLMQQYRFNEAVTRLQEEINVAKRRRKPVDDLEEQLARAQRLAVMVEGTQRVTFIDSIVDDKARMLGTLQMQLGEESGKITTYDRAFGKNDTLGCTVYQSQLGNLTLFAQPTGGRPLLYTSNLVGGAWSEAVPLNGLDDQDECQNYPFMLSDGVSFYYGAVNEEGAGGYDIYFSRYDNEERVFRTPENVGMPFNSTANDYMMCIDEFNRLGYLVTDRRQPAGKVCIYTFIPPTVRTNLADMGTSEEELCQRAALSSIAITQDDKQAVAEARKRQASMLVTDKAVKAYDFTFVIDDTRIYHFAADFKDKEAQKRVAVWHKKKKEMDETSMLLDAARKSYSAAKADRRNSLRQQILTMEASYEQALASLNALEKEIRMLENKKQ